MFLNRRDKEDNPYDRLQQQSLQMLQQLSGEVWTDFNPHDPGVTILDILNLALLELHYQLGFPLEDYLADCEGDTRFEQFGLIPASDLLSDSVVTLSDYERLITDNIPEVTACRTELGDDGLYQFTINTENEHDQKRIEAKVRSLYHANRNLCENIGNVRFGHVVRKEMIAETPPPINRSKCSVNPIYHKFGNYRSIQLDFPDCYGINTNGKQADISSEQTSRIMQLKAYLLIFDHLMANCIGQAGGVAQMLELSPDISEPQPPSIDTEDINALLDRSKLQIHDHATHEFARHRKKVYFDMLDTIYGEKTGSFFSETDTRYNEKRASLIRQFPVFNAGRFRSFDITDSSIRSVPTIKKTLAAINGINIHKETPITHLFTQYSLRLVPDNIFFREYKTMLNIEFALGDMDRNWNEKDLEHVPDTNIEHYSYKEFYSLKEQLYLFHHNVIFESFLSFGSDRKCYRIAELPDGSGFLLLFEHPTLRKWLNMGFFSSKEELVKTAGILWNFIFFLELESKTFYLLEHILVYDTPCDNTRRLSVVTPIWSQQPDSRYEYETAISERLPAHLDIDFLWMNTDQIYHFEKLYFPWRKAMAENNSDQIQSLSERLRDFLELYGTGQ